MRYLLLSIIIISLVGILMIPNAFAKEVIVQNVRGTSTAYDCEETNSCFNPNPVRININDKITWTNPDKAAHTVTSGNPIIGPDGYFDSSLIMAGDSYSRTFTSFGTYDYFCMVHPWMTGTIVVSEGTSSSSSTSKIYSNVILDPLPTTFKAGYQPASGSTRATITFSGELKSVDKKFFLSGATITLKFTGFTLDGKFSHEVTTDDKGLFNFAITLLPGNNYAVQAVFDGAKDGDGSIWTSSKSQTEYFTVTSSSSSQPTSNVGGPTFLTLEIETDKRVVTVSGKLTDKEKKIYSARNVKITLIPSGFTFNDNVASCKVSELPNCVLTTDNFGNFKVKFTLGQSSIGKKYSIQAVSAGNNQWESSSLTQSFTITSSSTSSSQSSTQSSVGSDSNYLLILLILGIVCAVAAVVIISKNKKKTPSVTPQRKTFGVKPPRKRRTVQQPPGGVPSSADGPSTYGYFECPNCHEPSAPQGKLGQNPDGSQFCSKCGWKS